MESLFKSAPDPALITDGQYWIDCNDAALQLFKKQYNEITDQPVIEILKHNQFIPDGRESVIFQELNKALTGQSGCFEWRIVPEKGKMPIDIEVLCYPFGLHYPDETISSESNKSYRSFSSANKQPLVQLLIRDISDKKKKERLYHRNFELFHQLFKNAPIGILLRDCENHIILVNQSFCLMFGYSNSELIGRNLNYAIVPKDEKEDSKILREKVCKGEPYQKETVRIHKDGTPRSVLIVGLPVFSGKEVIYNYVIYVDISKQKEAKIQ